MNDRRSLFVDLSIVGAAAMFLCVVLTYQHFEKGKPMAFDGAKVSEVGQMVAGTGVLTPITFAVIEIDVPFPNNYFTPLNPTILTCTKPGTFRITTSAVWGNPGAAGAFAVIPYRGILPLQGDSRQYPAGFISPQMGNSISYVFNLGDTISLAVSQGSGANLLCNVSLEIAFEG